MTITKDRLQHNILYSCTAEKKRGNEQFVVEHAFGCIISGETHFFTNKGTEIYKEGIIGLIRKNQLAKTIKVPAANGQPFRAINILLDQESLRRYSAEYGITAQRKYTGATMLKLSDDAFIKGYFESLIPYFDSPDRLTRTLADIKTKEAIELILKCDNKLKDFLFDFSEPHKIDLEAFMMQNYSYNVSLSQFARLTGRSLATFKRDFQKIFDSPPEKWIHQKRLEQAHFLISQKNQSPAVVYLEVGFQNLSHFSQSFKKFYGYNASSL